MSTLLENPGVWPSEADWPREEFLRALMCSFPDTVILFDKDGNYEEVLREGFTPSRRSESPLRGKSIFDLWPAPVAQGIQGAIQLAIETGRTIEHEYPIESQGETRWLLARGRRMEGPGPWQGRVLWVARHITERKIREEKFKQQKERTITFQETLLALAAMDKSDFDLSMEAILLACSDCLQVGRVSYWTLQDDPPAIVLECLVENGQKTDQKGTMLTEADFPIYFEALRTKKVISADDACTDDRTHEFAPTYLIPLGIGALMDVPVWFAGKAVGIICHEHLGGPRPWLPEEKEFGFSIGHMLSLALETRERQRANKVIELREAEIRSLFEEEQKELKRALRLQTATLAKQGSKFGSFRVSHSYTPASLLCGDFLEIYCLDKWLGLLVGDVSGHGPSAAMVTMALRSLFPHLMEEFSHPFPDPYKVLVRMGQEMSRIVPVDMHYATAILVMANLENRQIHMACAGHPRPILMDPLGRTIPVSLARIPPLNIGFESHSPSTWPIQMQQGQKLLLYTDGLPESFSPAGKIWGEDGFLNAVEAHAQLGGEQFLSALSDSAKDFRGGLPNRDDEAMLLLEIPSLLV